MRTCSRCKQNRADATKFWCRPCKQEYDREYWAKTKDVRNTSKRLNQSNIRDRNRQYIWNYLIYHPCIDCGNTNPIVLQFDHFENKVSNVADLTSASLETLQAEIDKCVVRCANCHIIKTSVEQNWYDKINRSVA